MLGAVMAMVVLGAVIFLFLNIEVIVKYQEQGDQNGVFLEILYLNRFFKKQYAYKNLNFHLARLLPFVGVRKEVEEGSGRKTWGLDLKVGLEEARKYLGNISRLLAGLDDYPFLKRLYFRTITIRELAWETQVGAADAMQTGLLAGGLWAVKGMILTYIGNKLVLRNAVINVLPQYDRELIATSFYCVLCMKVVHAPITTLLIRRQIWLEGRKE